jgi:hypothetical protein
MNLGQLETWARDGRKPGKSGTKSGTVGDTILRGFWATLRLTGLMVAAVTIQVSDLKGKIILAAS